MPLSEDGVARLRRIALLAAAALILGAVVVRLAPADSALARARPLLLLLGALLGVAGLLGPRFGSVYRGAAIILLNALVLFLVLDFTAEILRRPEGGLPQHLFGRADQRAVSGHWTLPYYQSRSWGTEYWRELHQIGTWYHPYVLWRRFPFQGRYIVVDSAGVRRTPGAECRPGALRVFAMGGSVMWGYGDPDSTTIPAYLQAELARRLSRPVCVVNLSEHGFNSTQDLITLQQHLVLGDVPDLVLLFQGVNDIWAAYSSGEPGVHGFLGEIAGKLEANQRGTPAAQLASRLALVQLVHPTHYREVSRWTMTDTALADRVVDVYLENYRIVRALAGLYGFEYQVYWQPSIFTGRKPLLPVEEMMRAQSLSEEVPAWPHMFARVYDDIARRAPVDGHFHDLRDVFDGRREQMYIDWAHLVPEANMIVTQRMLATLDLSRWRPPAVAGAPHAPGAGRPKLRGRPGARLSSARSR